jgi:hypothetical protein
MKRAGDPGKSNSIGKQVRNCTHGIIIIILACLLCYCLQICNRL